MRSLDSEKSLLSKTWRKTYSSPFLDADRPIFLDYHLEYSLTEFNSHSIMSKRHQQRKRSLLILIRDRLERQLSAVNASLATLENQIERDKNKNIDNSY